MDDSSTHLLASAVSVQVDQQQQSFAALHSSFRVYSVRWYVLALFFFLSANQSVLFLCFSPIADVAESYFGFSQWLVNLQVALGCLIYVAFVTLTSYVLERSRGFWLAMKISAGCHAAASLVRLLALIHPHSRASVVWITTGTVLNNVIAPLTLAGVSFVSALWFSESQRTTATAIAVTAGVFGTGVGLLLIPYITAQFSLPALFYLQAAAGCAVSLPILVYLPAAPPTPPSASAAAEQQHQRDHNVSLLRSVALFVRRTLQAFTNPSFVLLILANGTSIGTSVAWSSALEQLFATISFSDKQAGVLGSVNMALGVLGSVLVGPIADRYYRRRLRLFAALLMALGILLQFEFVACFPLPGSGRRLLHLQSMWFFLLTLGGTGLFLSAAQPLLFELCAEAVFPLSEGTSVGLMTLINNLVCVMFLYATRYVSIQTLNWVNTAAACSVLLVLSFMRETYNRSATALAAGKAGKSGPRVTM